MQQAQPITRRLPKGTSQYQVCLLVFSLLVEVIPLSLQFLAPKMRLPNRAFLRTHLQCPL